MKKFIAIFLVLIFAWGNVNADSAKPINVDQLPDLALKFINKHFSNTDVSFAKVDNYLWDTEYEVILKNGTKIEFDRKGNWKDIDCKRNAVPNNIIPEKIAEYVKTNFPQAKIVKIERNKRQYEVSLSNDMELSFDSRFNIIDIDD